jgi:hypothetical protein
MAALPSAQTRTIDDLTPAERRILAVLCDPKMYDRTETDRIAAAGVSRSRYYELLRDPSLHAIQREILSQTIASNVAAVVDKSITQAVTTGRDGFQDRKLLLEMGRFYTPHSQIDHNVKGHIVGIVGVKTDDI